MVEGPAGATSGVGGTVPDPYVTGRVADVDWAARAGTAERAIVRRHLRRLGGVVPGTRIGRIRWPRLPPVKPWPVALLVAGATCSTASSTPSCAAPRPGRADTIAAVARTVRLRNLGSSTNDYYDDVAWFGLAVQRAGTLARRSARPALGAITLQLRRGWTVDGGAASGGGAGGRTTGSRTRRERPRRDPAGPRRPRRAGGLHRRLDGRDAARPGDGPGPRRGAAGPDGAVRAVEAASSPTARASSRGVCGAGGCRRIPRWAARATALMDADRHAVVGPDGVVPVVFPVPGDDANPRVRQPGSGSSRAVPGSGWGSAPATFSG